MSMKHLLPMLHINQPSMRVYIPQIYEGVTIPRIIHQTYSSWDTLPGVLYESIAELRARNPGWEYCFYDDAAVDKFIRNAYGPNVSSRFERIDPRYGATRADLFRYLLIYRMGGVYLDIKSTARRPLDEILFPKDRLVLAQWADDASFDGWGVHDWDFAGKINGGEFQQWHIMCSPGHPYLWAVINAVLRNIDCYIPQMHGNGRNAALRLTGPIAYTLAMLPLMPKNLHRIIQGHRQLGLEYSVFPTNQDHKRLAAHHYTELRSPVVRANQLRRSLGHIYTAFDATRQTSLRAVACDRVKGE